MPNALFPKEKYFETTQQALGILTKFTPAEYKMGIPEEQGKANIFDPSNTYSEENGSIATNAENLELESKYGGWEEYSWDIYRASHGQ